MLAAVFGSLKETRPPFRFHHRADDRHASAEQLEILDACRARLTRPWSAVGERADVGVVSPGRPGDAFNLFNRQEPTFDALDTGERHSARRGPRDQAAIDREVQDRREQLGFVCTRRAPPGRGPPIGQLSGLISIGRRADEILQRV